MADIQEALLEEIKENNQTNREIVKVLTVGQEDPSWNKEDFQTFYAKQIFKFFGLCLAGALVFIPPFLDGISETNKSLILGSSLALIPSIVLNGQDPSKSKSNPQKKK